MREWVVSDAAPLQREKTGDHMFFDKALDDLTWSDIEALIAAGVEEGQVLEFKSGQLLQPPADGGGAKKARERTRDAIAKAAVAFANAYGGYFVLGVGEKDSAAVAIEPVSDLVAQKDALERAVRDFIEPPITGLTFRAIPDPQDVNSGVIVVRSPSSMLAPHGMGGREQVAYSRRGSQSQPMGMRDLQSVFWEARTRIERIDAVRRAQKEKLADLMQKKKEGKLVDDLRPSVSPYSHGLFFRAICVAARPLGAALPLSDKMITLRPPLDTPLGLAFGRAAFENSPLPTAHGYWVQSNGPSIWTMDEAGTVGVVGFYPQHPSKNEHYPDWYALTTLQLMLMGHRIRRLAARPDVELIVDCEFRHDGTAVVHEGGEWSLSASPPFLPHVEVAPVAWARAADLKAVFEPLRRQIWRAMGSERLPALNFDYEKHLAAPWPT